MVKKVLGLDIGSNSIGFSLQKIENINEQIVFNEIVSNSIVFSEPNSAEDRRKARGDRRRNERKSARKKFARRLFVKYGIAEKEFIENPTSYLNSFNLKDNDVYNLREKAINEKLSKDEFIYAVYSIVTNRGYNNMFSTSNEDGAILEPISKNKQEYIENNYNLPSIVLTKRRDDNKDIYQNFPIRNKKSDYSNSLDRDLHKEELIQVISSQSQNKNIFLDEEKSKNFLNELLDENIINTPFYQRTLKSFEGMVAYCSFYHKYNPKGQEKRVPLSNIKNIELTLRQKIDNYEIINKKSGEIESLSHDEIEKTIRFWIDTPSSKEINATNIFNILKRDLKLNIPEKVSQVVLNVDSHRKILEVLNKYEIDFKDEYNSFYNEVLLELYYFKNKSSREKHISQIIENYRLDINHGFIDDISSLDGMDGFGSFSLKFINEILEVMKKENKSYYDATNSLGYDSLYIGLPKYDYLPPLEPTNKDIEWLEKNLVYFKREHVFYQPMISPKVKRVIGILRKLINEIILKYGAIDEIRIETARELNSTKEEDRIKENQKKDKKKNDDAKKFLEANEIRESNKNIERAKLFIEQGKCICLYSNEPITMEEAFDENETEVEHFIPRSIIWINSYKNKILVKKKANQNKSNQNPINFLNQYTSWEDFKGRVENSFMNKNKKRWLTDENIINSVMEKDHWKDSFLNDTRTATKTIAKYLNHYLYPKQKEHGKDENKYIHSVSGKAISELKYIWGISDIMPKNDDGKKDRDTNYHHTLDAFTVALCSNTAINTLHSYFKKKENKFKTKVLKDKLTSNIPISKDGVNIVEYMKTLITKYEENRLYVCPYNKRKTNMKGFKDGNLKLYIAKDPKDDTKEILAEMEKVAIDKSLLIKKVNGFDKDRSDNEVLKEIEAIQKRLNTQKQKGIIKAIEVYGNELLKLRNEFNQIEKDIKPLDEKKKISKSKQDKNIELDAQIEELKQKKQNLSKEMEQLKCSFPIKNGKRQIVNSLKLYKTKIEQSKADAIIFPNREENKIERLNIENFNKAKEQGEPFVTKMNESTLCVDIYTDKKQGQLIGLNYFSSISNKNILPKCKKELTDANNLEIKLYKNDIVGLYNKENILKEIYTTNGGGEINAKNVIKLNPINSNSNKLIKISVNKDNIIKKLNISFLGNISKV